MLCTLKHSLRFGEDQVIVDIESLDHFSHFVGSHGFDAKLFPEDFPGSPFGLWEPTGAAAQDLDFLFCQSASMSR